MRVFAASSMTDVLPLIAERYREAHPEVEFEFAFGGSTVLATQIEQGAPVDVFVAANRAQAQRVLDAGFATAETLIAENTLVIAVAEDAPWGSVEELAAAAPRVAVAAPGVPVAVLTEIALAALDPAVAGPLRAGVVTRDANVRVALSRVETGEADAAFVYSTDLVTARGVRAIALPSQLPRNAYIAVLVTNDGEPPSAAATGFLAFLRGAEAAAVFADAGFIPVAASR